MIDVNYVKTIQIHIDEEQLLTDFIYEELKHFIRNCWLDYTNDEEFLTDILSHSDKEEIVAILYEKLLKKLDR